MKTEEEKDFPKSKTSVADKPNVAEIDAFVLKW